MVLRNTEWESRHLLNTLTSDRNGSLCLVGLVFRVFPSQETVKRTRGNSGGCFRPANYCRPQWCFVHHSLSQLPNPNEKLRRKFRSPTTMKSYSTQVFSFSLKSPLLHRSALSQIEALFSAIFKLWKGESWNLRHLRRKCQNRHPDSDNANFEWSVP